MPNVVYLHGFASSPLSAKAVFFQQRFAEIGAVVHRPRLDGGDFGALTIGGQLGAVAASVGALQPALLMGSSMGGYLAALYAAREPETCPPLVLMAPAFDFARRWSARLTPEQMEGWKQSGGLELYHYGARRREKVGYRLYAEALNYEAFPAVSQKTLVFHGRRDREVDPQLSIEFARGKPNVELEQLDSDHQLLDATDTMWARVKVFYQGLYDGL